jgi:hypothetical protein
VWGRNLSENEEECDRFIKQQSMLSQLPLVWVEVVANKNKLVKLLTTPLPLDEPEPNVKVE